MPQPPQVVVMGPSGSGKSTVGAALARQLGVPFVDADDLHPITNVDKMTAGKPLTDEDRWPWLAQVGKTMAESSDTGMVVACSALRRAYREAIRREAPSAQFVELHGNRGVLASRLDAREGHFMPASLLDSQLETLEPLGDDEPGIRIDIDASVQEIVTEIARRLVR